MPLHFFRTTLRGLFRHKTTTAINVTGLALALASTAVIVSHVRFESSYDSFHPDAERIYQVTYQEVGTPALRHVPTVSPPVAPALVAELPGVEAGLRFRIDSRRLVSVDENRYFEDGIVFADPALFDMLGFDLLQGNRETALMNPENIVLTRSMARKYFGDGPAVGRQIIVDDERTLTVTGVMQDLPANTHMRMDFVMPFDAFRVPSGYPVTLDSWQWISFPTFIRLAPGVDPGGLDEDLQAFMARHFSPRSAETARLRLQPITEVYLNGPVDPAFVRGNRLYLKGLGGIAALILLLSVFNFANLSAAQALRRTREAGVRRVMGASGWRLSRQFLGETTLLAVGGAAIALGLVGMASVLMPGSGGFERALDMMGDPQVILASVGLLLVIGAGAGLYPAVFLSRIRIPRALRGGGTTGARTPMIRRGLIITQFAIASGLIVASLTISKQLTFLTTSDPGFDREQVLAVEMERDRLTESFSAVRAELERSSRVVAVSASGELFDGHAGSMAMTHEGADEGEVSAMNLYGVDYSFVETMGLNVIRGRSWDRSLPADSVDGIVINESAARYFSSTVPEWSEPLGRNLQVSNIMSGRVIGVVEDFHYTTLHSPIEPLVMIISRAAMEHLLIRVVPGNTAGLIEDLTERWTSVVPGVPFNFRFLDDHLAAQYETDRILARMVSVFTALALAIACLGLYAMASFMCALRQREMAIRKVLGAATGGVLALLLKPFTAYILIANILALPLVWLAMDRWLDSFAYRIEPGMSIFLVSVLATLVIGLMSVLGKSFSAARVNPAVTLAGD